MQARAAINDEGDGGDSGGGGVCLGGSNAKFGGGSGSGVGENGARIATRAHHSPAVSSVLVYGF